MDSTIEVLGNIGLFFFTFSLFTLRYTIMSLIQGNKDSFSMFLNLHKSTCFVRREHLFLKTIGRTFKKGERATKCPPNINEVLSYEGLIRLINEVKEYRDVDPKYGDSCLYAIRSISWGIWTMRLAFAAFISKLLVLILKLI